MKHTLALVLMVFGIVGCASTSSVNNITSSKSYEELTNHKAEVINMETGEKFFVGDVVIWHPVAKEEKSQMIAKVRAVALCDENFEIKALKAKLFPYPSTILDYELMSVPEFKDSKCKVSRVDDLVIYNDRNAYLANQEKQLKAQEAEKLMLIKRDEERKEASKLLLAKRMEAAKKARKQAEVATAERKERKVKELIRRCEDFGFRGETNIAACIQREAQVDIALAKQQNEIDLLNQQAAAEAEDDTGDDFMDDLSSIFNTLENNKKDKRLKKAEAEVKARRSAERNRQSSCVLNRNC